MKKILLSILVLLLITNVVFAANWITVKASNGKTALLDTLNVEVENQIAKYWVKSTKNGYTYRYYMMSDCSSQTSCIIETYKYDSKGNPVDSSSNSVNLEKIVPDTLNEAIYKKVCDIVRKNPLSIEPAIWTVYLEDINKEVKTAWKPAYSKTNEKELITSISYTLDKNGKVLSKDYTKKSGNEEFDKSVEAALQNVYRFAYMPDNFDGELELILTFRYAIKGEPVSDSATMNSDGIGEIVISKSKFHAGQAILKGVGAVVVLPFAILGYMLDASAQ